MPFADRRGMIPLPAEKVGHREAARFDERRTEAAEHALLERRPPVVAARENRVARRRADRGRRVRFSERQAVGREAVEVRRGDLPRRIEAPHVAVAEVVGEDEHDVGRPPGPRGRRRGGRRGARDRQQEPDADRDRGQRSRAKPSAEPGHGGKTHGKEATLTPGAAACKLSAVLCAFLSVARHGARSRLRTISLCACRRSPGRRGAC